MVSVLDVWRCQRAADSRATNGSNVHANFPMKIQALARLDPVAPFRTKAVARTRVICLKSPVMIALS